MRKVFVILVSSTIFAVMFWIVVMLGAALAEESYFPVLNPIHIQAGRNYQPGLVSTGNIDATTSTITALTTLAGTANAQTVNVSGTLSMTGSTANIVLGSNYLSGDGGDEGIYVGSTGNVGIGTSSPSTNLHVYNGGILANVIWLKSFAFVVNNADDIAIKDSYARIAISGATNTNIMYMQATDEGAGGCSIVTYTNTPIVLGANNAAVLTIQSASYELTGAVGNSAAIFDSVAIRSGVFQEGLKAPYKKDIETLDGNPVDLITTDEVPTIYRYKINPEWAEEKAEKIYQAELKEYQKRKEGQEPVKRVEPVHEGWQEGFIREKLPERYHTPDGGINLSLIAQDALARVAALEKRVEALEERR